MWEFYLASSEVGFRRLGHMVFQLQLTRRQDAAPLTRYYLSASDQFDPVAFDHRIGEQGVAHSLHL